MTMTAEIKKKILSNSSMLELRRLARRAPMRTEQQHDADAQRDDVQHVDQMLVRQVADVDRESWRVAVAVAVVLQRNAEARIDIALQPAVERGNGNTYRA
jgi:hypothetical protein